LLVPSTTTDPELMHIRNSLPESVVVQRVEERLSALGLSIQSLWCKRGLLWIGNCVVCNDYYALIHPDMDRETEEIIADVLGVEVFRCELVTFFIMLIIFYSSE